MSSNPLAELTPVQLWMHRTYCLAESGPAQIADETPGLTPDARFELTSRIVKLMYAAFEAHQQEK